MTPDQADNLAIHIAKVWADEHVDTWAAQLADLDHDHTIVTLTECRRLYTGRSLHPVSFRTAYGPTWPTLDPDPAPCGVCGNSGVIDLDPDTGLEHHCECGHGHRRARLAAPPQPATTRYLTDDERTRGLAMVAGLRAQLNRSAQ